MFAEVVRLRPDARYVYAADDGGFPYGPRGEADLVGHVGAVLERLVAAHRPDLVVIACNTASTLVLPHVRARWPDLPFVGTVPAIKPAAAASLSRIVAVIATPGTVARDYTRALVASYAGDCRVVLVGSLHLAGLAEAAMRGEAVGDEAIRAEILPCFVEEGGRRTDVAVLACTHFPLLLSRLERLAPWPVTWIDPAPAIARQAAALLGARFPALAVADAALPAEGLFVFTSGAAPEAALAPVLAARGLRSGVPVASR